MKQFFCLIAAAATALCAQAFKADTITVTSKKYLAEPMKVTVITPDSKNSDDQFPSLYLLNGHGGDYRAWGNIRKDLGEYADRYGMIMVMPSGMDSWYWDSPRNDGMQMESFITEILVPHIDNTYPTIQDRNKRAIMGLSMGGHGALYLAGRHSNMFGAAGSTSGGLDIRPFAKRWGMDKHLGDYEQNKEIWNQHTVARMAGKFRNANIALIIDCGTDDFFAKVNDMFHHSLQSLGVPHDYITRPGNHSQKYWANSLLYQLVFFNEFFNKPVQSNK